MSSNLVLAQLVRRWAQESGKTSEALAQEVFAAQSRLPNPPKSGMPVSTSWVKRVRSGRFHAGVGGVDSRYRALLLLVAESENPQEKDALVERWSDVLSEHFSSKRGPQGLAQDFLGVRQEFLYVTGNPDFGELGFHFGVYLSRLAMSDVLRKGTLTQLRSRSFESPPSQIPEPPGFNADQINRGLRAALDHLRKKVRTGEAGHPYTAICLMPVLDEIFEIACDLSQLRKPLWGWLNALVRD